MISRLHRGCVLVLVGLCLAQAPVASANAPRSLEPPPPPSDPQGPRATLSPDSEVPLLAWAAVFAVEEILSRLLDPYFDRVADWLGIKPQIDLGSAEALRHCRNPHLSADERALMCEIAQMLGDFSSQLTRQGRSIADLRREMERRYGNLEARLNAYQRRLRAVEARLYELELQQREHYRLIVDNQGRIRRLEEYYVNLDGRLVDVEGRLVRAEAAIERNTEAIAITNERIRIVEEYVFPNPNRFLRYDAYVGIQGMMAGIASPERSFDAGLGGSVDVQYNFNEYFGMFAMAGVLPVERASFAQPGDSGSPEGAGTVYAWDNVAAVLGGSFNLIPPDQPVSLQLGVGVGLMQSTLYDSPAEATPFSRAGSLTLARSNAPVLAARVDLGISPVRYPIEPYVSAGVFALGSEVVSETPGLSLGSALWHASIGLRVRYDIRLRRAREPLVL